MIHIGLSILILILFAVIKAFIFRNSSIWLFAKLIALEPSPFAMYISTLNLLFYRFPYLMQVVNDLICLAHVFYIKWDVDLVPAEVQFNNFDVVQKLGCVNNVVLSLSAVYPTLGSNVAILSFNNNMYNNEADAVMKNQAKTDNSSGSEGESDDESHEFIDYLPNEVIKNNVFANKEVTKIAESGTASQKVQL
jgi:hypothetical protein